MKQWKAGIETKLENGFPDPAPIEDNQYSGKFVLRLPKSLHAKLATEAEREGVSLNEGYHNRRASANRRFGGV